MKVSTELTTKQSLKLLNKRVKVFISRDFRALQTRIFDNNNNNNNNNNNLKLIFCYNDLFSAF